MSCRIYLRRDQFASQRSSSSSEDTTICAPLWVKEALQILAQHLQGVTFELHDTNKSWNLTGKLKNDPIDSFTISPDFNNQSLKDLQRIARNESLNVSGVINTTLYSEIKDKRVLYSIRDLVRQCVIVGVDQTCGYGGYKCVKGRQPKQRVYVCDLAALQFQQPYNTGRLVLIQKDEPHKGILDDFIYENVVGEPKKCYEYISAKWERDKMLKDRYWRHDGYGLPGRQECFIDTLAYKRFVALDVVLSGLVIAETASSQGDVVNFKFLKYGTGFFAGKFARDLDRLILFGVLDGLEKLFTTNDGVLKTIKCIELPFYKCDSASEKRINKLKASFGMDFIFSKNDALLQTSPDLVTATTNCGDNHVVCGNEMGFASVDAAISEHLLSKGNIFNPNLNLSMKEKFFDV